MTIYCQTLPTFDTKAFGGTPLNIACARGHTAILRALVNCAGEDLTILSHCAPLTGSPLYALVEHLSQNQSQVLVYSRDLLRLLQHGADPNVTGPRQPLGTPLAAAVVRNNKSIVEQLLAFGARWGAPSGLHGSVSERVVALHRDDLLEFYRRRVLRLIMWRDE